MVNPSSIRGVIYFLSASYLRKKIHQSPTIPLDSSNEIRSIHTWCGAFGLLKLCDMYYSAKRTSKCFVTSLLLETCDKCTRYHSKWRKRCVDCRCCIPTQTYTLVPCSSPSDFSAASKSRTGVSWVGLLVATCTTCRAWLSMKE